MGISKQPTLLWYFDVRQWTILRQPRCALLFFCIFMHNLSFLLWFWKSKKVCTALWKYHFMCISRTNCDMAVFAPDFALAPLTGVTDHTARHNPGQSPNVHYPKTSFFRDSFICLHRILLFTKTETNSQYLFLWIIQTYAPTYTYTFFMYC